MPFVQVQTASGSVSYHYTISTPAAASARWIDEKLPTVLFLHGVWLAQEVFHLQFTDTKIRRFNLISLDLRFYGQTTGPPLPQTYDKEAAADDIAKFMDALYLPPCHVVGLSMGTIIALQLGISYPAKVRSLFLMGALILEEPLEVAKGREEVCQYWMESFTDEDALLAACYGGYQLVCSNKPSSFVDALATNLTSYAKRNWGPEHFDEYRLATVDFITKRRSPTKEELSKIKVSVEIVHGMDNMLYSLEYCEKQVELLQEAGVDVSLVTIEEAPHFVLLSSNDVNPVLFSFLLSNSKEDVKPFSGDVVWSPWYSILRDAGYVSEDSDDDIFVITC
uniref:Putative alpha/beta-hydrolase n=1 Tax=Moniliophthora roreri TaxID=221103 RepID=A0A0W0EWD3_MONRR